jgi:hypothetical protein
LAGTATGSGAGGTGCAIPSIVCWSEARGGDAGDGPDEAKCISVFAAAALASGSDPAEGFGAAGAATPMKAPHSEQNLARSAKGWPQCTHVMGGGRFLSFCGR